MRRKPPSKSFLFYPSFDIDGTHLDEISHIVGPEAQIVIETKEHEFSGIDELRKFMQQRTRLVLLKIKLGVDTLEVVPQLRAYGPGADELEPRIALILSAARRHCSLRWAGVFFAIGAVPQFLLDVLPHAGSDDLHWRALQPTTTTLVWGSIATTIGVLASKLLLDSRITPQQRQVPFLQLNANALKMACAGSLITIAIGAAVGWIRGCL